MLAIVNLKDHSHFENLTGREDQSKRGIKGYQSLD